MLCLSVLIHQRYMVLSQKPGLRTQFDLNRQAAQKDFSLYCMLIACVISFKAHFSLLVYVCI